MAKAGTAADEDTVVAQLVAVFTQASAIAKSEGMTGVPTFEQKAADTLMDCVLKLGADGLAEVLMVAQALADGLAINEDQICAALEANFRLHPKSH
jgi:hypothetical protein